MPERRQRRWSREKTRYILKAWAEKFEDPDVNVRADAVRTLGRTLNPYAIPRLAKSLRNDEHFFVREWAATELGGIHHPSVVARLAKALKDPVGVVRNSATIAFVRVGRGIINRRTTNKHAQALQLVAPHFLENESTAVVEKAFTAALKEKISAKNARLYVKQLRAMHGNLKPPA